MACGTTALQVVAADPVRIWRRSCHHPCSPPCFSPIGDKPSRIYTDTNPPHVDSSHFATALATIVGAPVERGGTITMLNNGDEFVPALLDSIAKAERTINFAVYIWAEGEFSDRLLAHSKPGSAPASPSAYCSTGWAASRCPTKTSKR